MINAASCKFDGGQSCVTRCFPGRTLLGRNREGAGHWLVAHRNAQAQSYRTKLQESYKHSHVADAPGNTLDGALLLQLHRVDSPSELCSVDISEQNLTSVKPEDLKPFDNLAYVDACINSLSLGSFNSFESLREINLSVNGIHNLAFDAADFPHLEVLNLSYNYLSSDDIVSIGGLPRLKVLHLTGNQLHHLPPDLGLSNCGPAQPPTEGGDARFRALEVLMLDNNKLSSRVFSSLTNLKRLKHLNLQGNHISEVPYLQLLGCSEPALTSAGEQAKEDELAHAEPDPNVTEMLKRIPEKKTCEGIPVSRSCLPLTELQVLNLAENKIAEEEALMAVGLFPKLRELDIHSNPLTTKRSGDPPLLTYYLQESLGITIKRKKDPDVVKLPLKVKDLSRSPSLTDAHRPAQTQAEKSEEKFKRAPESEGQDNRGQTFQEHTQHFFATQAADFSQHDLETDEKHTAANKEAKEDGSAVETFDCYKLLMGAKLKPDALEPIGEEIVGIQTAVRMLEHTLKNLNVYRDSKPKLDSIQTPHREKEKRVRDRPSLKPVKQLSERVNDMMKEIKRSTTTREVALGSVVHGTDANEREYKEAVSLLRHTKTKYELVHKKRMRRVAQVEFSRSPELHVAGPQPELML